MIEGIFGNGAVSYRVEFFSFDAVFYRFVIRIYSHQPYHPHVIFAETKLSL